MEMDWRPSGETRGVKRKFEANDDGTDVKRVLRPCRTIYAGLDAGFRSTVPRPFLRLRAGQDVAPCYELLPHTSLVDLTSLETVITMRRFRPHNDVPDDVTGFVNDVQRFSERSHVAERGYEPYLYLHTHDETHLRNVAELAEGMRWSSGERAEYDRRMTNAVTGRPFLTVTLSDDPNADHLPEQAVCRAVTALQNPSWTNISLSDTLFASVLEGVRWSGRGNVVLESVPERHSEMDAGDCLMEVFDAWRRILFTEERADPHTTYQYLGYRNRPDERGPIPFTRDIGERIIDFLNFWDRRLQRFPSHVRFQFTCVLTEGDVESVCAAWMAAVGGAADGSRKRFVRDPARGIGVTLEDDRCWTQFAYEPEYGEVTLICGML